MTERTEIDAFKSSEDLHLELIKNSPKVVSSFVPSNALDQKNRFLSGDIENTSHRYDRLEQIDFEEKLYGEPEEVVCRSLINEKLRKIEEKDLSPDAEFIKHELFDMISIKPEGEGSNERFSPSQDPTNIEHRRLVYESKTVE